MLSLLLSLLCAAAAVAQQPVWYGVVRGAGNAQTYNIVELNDKGTVTPSKVVASVTLTSGESYLHTDAMRCLSGFCAFMSSSTDRKSTFSYRIDTLTGKLLARVQLPGDCAHLHADYTSGNLYTLCLGSTGGADLVMEVSGPSPTVVLDVTKQLNGGRVLPGQTTHCSAFKSMYIGVDLGGAGKDALVTVDLVALSAKVLTLQSPMWRTLWARCDGSNEVGGIGWEPGTTRTGNGTAYFGTLSTASGQFQRWQHVGVPQEMEPSGLLTETEVEQSIATFYPIGTHPNATNPVAGFVWAVDPFSRAGDDFVSPINYMVSALAVCAPLRMRVNNKNLKQCAPPSPPLTPSTPLPPTRPSTALTAYCCIL